MIIRRSLYRPVLNVSPVSLTADGILQFRTPIRISALVRCVIFLVVEFSIQCCD